MNNVVVRPRKLVIQIPCYNEEQVLGHTLTTLPRQVPGFSTVEFLIIDDGSRDRTAEVARQGGVDHIVSLPHNQGLARARNRGASEARGVNIGLNITLPFEQSNNPYITRRLAFDFHYFFMRKYWFAYLAKAIVVMPGGLTRVALRRGTLLVVGAKLSPPMDTAQRFHLAERSYGRFARAVRLAGAVNAARAQAFVTGGQLRVVLPRLEERRGQIFRIAVSRA